MNEIKREIDDFIGSKPRFTHQIKNQILTELEGNKMKHSSTLFSNFKYFTVSIVLVSLATFFVFSIVNKNEVTSPTSDTSKEDSGIVVENDNLNEQLISIEESEQVRRNTEEVAQKFLLAMSLGDREAIEPLLLPGTVLEDDFSIPFSDTYTYTKSNWNLYENIAFTKLNGFGFSDESSKDKQIFWLHYQFIPKKKDGYHDFVNLQLELINDQWFISYVYEDV